VLLANLPALQVVIPLVSAPLCLLLRNPRHAWAWATLVSTMVLAVAVMLAQRVYAEGTISYAIGAWATPWGIEYRIDMAGALMILLIAAIGAVIMPYARRSIRHEIARKHITLFYTSYLLCLTGLLGIVVTGDAFLVMGTIGATFILIGVGLLYMMTGTLNMTDLAQRLPEVTDTRTIRVAFAFVTVGVSIKLALFPLHIWLPNAYTFAPSVVSAFMAATATKAGVYVLLRFFFTVFGSEFSFTAMHVGEILMLLAFAAILVASLVAVFENNVKRMLAYSSVAQIGYTILGISLASTAGVTAGIIHLVNHALIKGALFLALGCVFLRLGSVTLKDMHGLARHMPWTMAAFVAGGLSLIGMPLTAGFISKWYLVSAVLAAGYWPLALLVLVSSLLALIYIWRVVEAAYFNVPGAAMQKVKEAPASMLIPVWLLIGVNLYVGIDASLIFSMAQQAADTLIGQALQ
jgi:multicomponent Na+:H+ antiporter subunit D